MRDRTTLMLLSTLGMGGLGMSIIGLEAGWWGQSTTIALAVGSGLWMTWLMMTSKCPSCGKSAFIKQGYSLPFPELYCSRCRTELD